MSRLGSRVRRGMMRAGALGVAAALLGATLAIAAGISGGDATHAVTVGHHALADDGVIENHD